MSAPIEDDREAMHRERSRRYAEALATAAAADEQVKALIEQLAEAEYHRRTAEDAAAVVQYLDDLDTHVYKVGDPEPDERVTFLFSLVTGVIFYRFRYRDDSPWAGWKRLDFASNTIFEWGGVLEDSPFVALTSGNSDYGIDLLVRQVNDERAQATEARRLLPRGSYNSTLADQVRELLAAHKGDEETWFAKNQKLINDGHNAAVYAQRMADALDTSASDEQRATALDAWRTYREGAAS